MRNVGPREILTLVAKQFPMVKPIIWLYALQSFLAQHRLVVQQVDSVEEWQSWHLDAWNSDAK